MVQFDYLSQPLLCKIYLMNTIEIFNKVFERLVHVILFRAVNHQLPPNNAVLLKQVLQNIATLF